MDTILIVDDNEDILETLTEGLRLYKSQFSMITASDATQAIRLLNENKISLVATDLMMPEIGGLELIAYMTRNFPAIPCIVMSRFDNVESREFLFCEGVLRCIEKPFKIQEIASAIIEGLDLLDEGITRKGIALSSFLLLIEIDRLTCLLKVKSTTTGIGLLYFENGILFDATYRKLEPEEAAIVMLTWESVEISFLQSFPKKNERRIFSELNSLISEAGQIIQKNSQIEEFSVSSKEPAIPEVFIAPQPKLCERDVTEADASDIDFIEEEIFVEIKLGNQDLVEAKLSGLAAIDGFKAVIVFSPGGEIIAGKFDRTIPFEKIGDLVFDIVRKAGKCSRFIGLGQFRTIDLETPEGEHMLVQGYTEQDIKYLTVLVCSGHTEAGHFREELARVVPALAEHIKIR